MPVDRPWPAKDRGPRHRDGRPPPSSKTLTYPDAEELRLDQVISCVLAAHADDANRVLAEHAALVEGVLDECLIRHIAVRESRREVRGRESRIRAQFLLTDGGDVTRIGALMIDS